jgi:heme/copper-type cytochrome/quinol oxidase subunit 2
MITRRGFAMLLGAAGAFGLVHVVSGLSRTVRAQEQAPNRREFTLTVRDFRFSPDRMEVMQDDLVTVTVRSEDVAHSFVIDEYRIVKRVPAGGTTTFEFRADRAGTFPFYCNITSDAGHGSNRGQLMVRTK